MAVVALLVGLPTSLGQARFVALDGRSVVVSPGTDLAAVARAQNVAPTAGARVDLIGDVRVPGGGEAGRFDIAGSPAPAVTVLRDGDVVTSRRGANVAEAATSKSEELPFKTTIQGEGSVVSVAVKGSNGERRSVRGVDSGRTALRVTLKVPVDQVVRRTASVAGGQKAVALTFDDGPSEWTGKVFDVLDAKGATGTFFFLGRNVGGRGSLVDRARSLGFEVETHGWSHDDLTKMSAGAARNDISKGVQAIGGAKFLRPAYGKYNGVVAAQAAALGLRLALWNVDTLDWQSKNADAILAKVKEQTRAGSIILMHDGGGDRSATVAALPRVIDWLLQQGYAVTNVSRLTAAS